MAAPKSKKSHGGGDRVQNPSAPPAPDDASLLPVEDTTGVERRYYWLQLLEFKVLPRVRCERGLSVQGGGVAKTTSDSVRVVVRPLGKGKPRKRAAAASPPHDPPGSSKSRRRT